MNFISVLDIRNSRMLALVLFWCRDNLEPNEWTLKMVEGTTDLVELRIDNEESAIMFRLMFG